MSNQRQGDARHKEGQSQASGDAGEQVGLAASGQKAAATAANAKRAALGFLQEHNADEGDTK